VPEKASAQQNGESEASLLHNGSSGQDTESSSQMQRGPQNTQRSNDDGDRQQTLRLEQALGG